MAGLKRRLRHLGPAQPGRAAARCRWPRKTSRASALNALHRPSCNPYLAFTVLLHAGLRGIKDGLTLQRR